MKLNNIEKDTNVFDDLLVGRLPFSTETLIKIQDIIELGYVQYSQENIDNLEFFNIIADKWPESYSNDQYPGVYKFKLNHAGNNYISVELDVYKYDESLYVDGITVKQQM